MPKISVIIPVYNAEKTIVRCVDSLLKQTLQDMEVIIVDDHGQDESIKTIQKHIAEHPRKNMFHFVETAVNSGPCEARNIGLQLAKGEYVAFLDSDDWVENEMYATLYETAIQYSADLCCCSIFQENVGRLKTKVSVKQGVFSDQDKRYFLRNFRSFFTPYIYRREMLNTYNISFSSEKSAEDVCFLTSAILCAMSVAQVDKALYHYTHNEKSLSRFQNDQRYLDKLSAFRKLFNYAKKHYAKMHNEVGRSFYEEYQHELQFVYFKKAYLAATLNYLKNAKRPKIKVLREIYNELLDVCPNYNVRKVIASAFQLIATKLFRKL